MKTKLLITATAIMMAMSFGANAQAPEKFNYQGIARDSNGDALANQALGLQISILNPSDTPIYVEEHNVTTNDFGLYHVVIGDGSPVTGTMGAVNWAGGTKKIKVEIDPNGGTSYTSLGTTELLSVPYALYAASAPGGGGSNPTGPAGGDLNGTYPNPGIANNAVTSAKIDNGTIATADMANNAVTSAKIDNATIATADLANNSVTGAKIAGMGATTGQVLEYDGTDWAPSTISTGGGALWTQSGSDIHYNTGNVGIGVTNPTADLHVNGTAKFDGGNFMYVSIYEQGSYLGYWGSYSGAADDVDFGTAAASTAKVHLVTQASPKLTIDKDGKVGIGTTTPSNMLEITGPDPGAQFVSIAPTSLSTADDVLQLSVPSTESGYQFIEANNGTGNVFVLEENGDVISNGSVEAVEFISKSTTATTPGLTLIDNNSTNNWGLTIASTNNLWFEYNGTLASFINTSGTYSTSDKRLKENIKPVGKVLDKINDIEIMRYNFKKDQDKKEVIGYIAQNLLKQFPEFVKLAGENREGVDYYGVNYAGMSAVAIKAIQEQQAEIEKQKTVNDAQQQLIEQLQQKIAALEKAIKD